METLAWTQLFQNLHDGLGTWRASMSHQILEDGQVRPRLLHLFFHLVVVLLDTEVILAAVVRYELKQIIICFFYYDLFYLW